MAIMTMYKTYNIYRYSILRRASVVKTYWLAQYTFFSYSDPTISPMWHHISAESHSLLRTNTM